MMMKTFCKKMTTKNPKKIYLLLLWLAMLSDCVAAKDHMILLVDSDGADGKNCPKDVSEEFAKISNACINAALGPDAKDLFIGSDDRRLTSPNDYLVKNNAKVEGSAPLQETSNQRPHIRTRMLPQVNTAVSFDNHVGDDKDEKNKEINRQRELPQKSCDDIASLQYPIEVEVCCLYQGKLCKEYECNGNSCSICGDTCTSGRRQLENESPSVRAIKVVEEHENEVIQVCAANTRLFFDEIHAGGVYCMGTPGSIEVYLTFWTTDD